MKIIMGSDLFYPVLYSGGEVHLFNVARWLAKLGHEVTVIAARTAYNPGDIKQLKDREVVDGINIIRTKTPFRFGSTLSSLPTMREMYKLVKEQVDQGADIVCPNQYRPCLPFFLATRKKVPCIAIFHDIYSQGRFLGIEGWKDQKFWGIPGWALEKMTLKLPYDHVITVSASTKQKLLKYYPEGKISIVYNGVDLEKIDLVDAGGKKPNQVMFLGSFKEHKNILDAIKAVELARKQIDNLELVIASTGGPQEALVKNMSKERRYIKYLGKVSEEEKIQLLKESSLLLLPSSAEGFGIVLIEALSCQTPFIAYDIPAVREVCALTKGGVTVKCLDYEAMAEKLCSLWSNKGLLQELASAGREEVERKFTWQQVAKKEAEVFTTFS